MKRLLFIVFLISYGELSWGQIDIEVIYPRPNADGSTPSIDCVDSNFVFGNVDPIDCSVKVNGVEAVVYSNGAFLAFVPVDKIKMSFQVTAKCGEWEVAKDIPFTFRNNIPPASITTALPSVLEITHHNAVVRYSANQGVYYLFPAKGARCYADSAIGNSYRIKLSRDDYVWIEQRFVANRTDLTIPQTVRIYSLKAFDLEDGIEIKIPCGNFPLHRITIDDNPSRLNLFLYGVESHIDRIENRSDRVRAITWEQPASDILQLCVILDDNHIWGYHCEIDSIGNFHLYIKKVPNLKLSNLRIALDAGHGGNDNGAIGPTGLKEKEVNFDIALRLALLLEDRNASVFLTRTTNEFIDVYRRIDDAVEWGADILVSIHNNALPDGVNPFGHRGYGVYYYHPQAVDLARSVQKGFRKNIELPDNGIFYANLAIPRATQLPAVLVESAFIMHPEDEMLLQEDEFRQRVAEAIFRGISDYIESLRNLVN
jgi:N-acetylmuramoyl-L-alanine amidase